MDFSIFLHGLTSYFVIIDPIGAALIFHALTMGKERKYRRLMAIKSCLISTVIVLLFGFFGESFLGKLGISIDALRVSGGTLLFVTAFQLITQKIEYEEETGRIDISVFPMSIPLIAGPGCLTLTILLFSAKNDAGAPPALILSVIIVYAATFCCFLLSDKIQHLIRRTGADILRRLLGVILAALAVQFISDGILQLMK